ncbi:MAG: ethanolamine utilization microcompartment protein EutL [Candidatus Sericytochromatia bacterium]|nr:ethanolamine utilization microcompartment protein EutL [Candidatus Sericytochromatia bacterium]
MGILEVIRPKILSLQKIPFVNNLIAEQFEINKEHISLGLLTVNLDHALFVAMDQGTKDSDADVAYKSSFYANNTNSSGQVIGIFSGKNPTIIDNAINSTVNYLNEKANFYSANIDNSIIFFPHVIGSIGRFLADETGLLEGDSIAYLFAPPIEALVSIDHALKNSDTRLVKFFKPPTFTNFAGAYLTGSISDCQAAAQAFSEKIIDMTIN